MILSGQIARRPIVATGGDGRQPDLGGGRRRAPSTRLTAIWSAGAPPRTIGGAPPDSREDATAVNDATVVTGHPAAARYRADWVPLAADLLERPAAHVEADAATTSFVVLGGTSLRAVALAAAVTARCRRTPD